MADIAPWLLVGLGNPGSKYAENRHNVGFMVVQRWVEQNSTPGVSDPWREKFHGCIAPLSTSACRCVALRPLTYMNRSGKSVQAAKAFYGVAAHRIIVVHDEIDFPFARVAVKVGGGHGGHNGLRDIIAVTGSRDFVRIRVGVGRPDPRAKEGPRDVSAWVLSDFSAEDRADLPDVVDRAVAAATAVMTDGLRPAMNQFNQTPSTDGSTASSEDSEPPPKGA